MASLNRPTRATYVVNENVTVDTTDNEDHTFRLVMKRIGLIVVMVIMLVMLEFLMPPCAIGRFIKISIYERD